MLENFYGLKSLDLEQEQKPKSAWKAENKLGFLLGVIRWGEKQHITELETFYLQANLLKIKILLLQNYLIIILGHCIKITPVSHLLHKINLEKIQLIT